MRGISTVLESLWFLFQEVQLFQMVVGVILVYFIWTTTVYPQNIETVYKTCHVMLLLVSRVPCFLICQIAVELSSFKHRLDPKVLHLYSTLGFHDNHNFVIIYTITLSTSYPKFEYTTLGLRLKLAKI